MFKERTVSRFFGGLLGAVSAFGSMGALASGMRFTEISLVTVLLVCVAGSAFFAVLAGRKIFAAVPILFPLGCLWLWYSGSLEPAVEAFLNQLSILYDMGYGWGVISWMETPVDPEAATLMFCLLGLLVSMAVTWAVVRGRSGWLAVPMVFLPLVPCLLLTDTVPEAKYVFLQLLSVLLLLLSNSVRKRNAHQGNKLLGILLIPVTAALALLFCLMPRESYAGQKYAQEMETFFLELLQIQLPEESPSGSGNGMGFTLDSSGRIQLGDVGPKVALRIPVMSVTAEETGLMYLRGTAYNSYKGTHWDEDNIDYRYNFYDNGEPVKTVTISTRTVRDFLYLPYAAKNVLVDGRVAVPNVKGKVDNEDNIREYTVQYSPVTDTSNLKGSAYQYVFMQMRADGSVYPVEMEEPYLLDGKLERYLQLNAATKLAAQELLDREIPGWRAIQDDWQKAKLIVEYVRNSATYDLQTEKMPSGTEDFGMWFLEESDTGYCTHFATAAAVLLRAAGVPCRYVTGYLARTQAGETVTVLQRNAHAWVEVLVYHQGWVVVEATPGGGVDDTARADVVAVPEDDPTESQQPTDPDDPQQPTKPETPEEPTEPMEPTEPEMPVDPDTPAVTVPSRGDDPENTETSAKRFVLPGWAKVILLVLSAIATVVGQWKTRVFLRQRRYARGSNNARVLAMWRDAEKYARLLKTEPAESLLELARKARFSQYRLTKEEVAAMTFGLKDLRRTLWRANRRKKLYARLILALY